MSFFYQNRKEQLYLYLSNNNPYAVHLHRQLELIYVLSGSTTVTVEQQEFPLTPGQGVLVFPNQMHGLKHVEPGQNLLCIFEPDFCHSFRHFFQNKKPSRNDFAISTLSEHSHIALQGLEALASSMEKDRPTPSDVQIYAEGYLTLLLADLLPTLSPPADPEKHGGSGTGAEAASLSGCQLHEGIVPGQSLERIRCQPFCPLPDIYRKVPHLFPGLCEFQKT